MAKTMSKKRQNLMKFKEVLNAINNSFGDKKGIMELSEAERKLKFGKNRDAILNGVELLVEYLEMNPSQIIDYARNARNNTELMIEAQSKLNEFLIWISKEKNITLGSAKTYRGNACSLLKWNSCEIKLKTPKGLISLKEKRDQKLGIDNDFKDEIADKMFKKADFEMKCFMAISKANGHRISDHVKLDVESLRNFLNNNQDRYIVFKNQDKKTGLISRYVFGKFQKAVIGDYIETIKDSNQKFLFGDNKDASTIRRLREKLETLLHSVFECDSNIITPHFFRSSCQTLLANHGVNDTQIKQFTGDSNKTYKKMTNKQLINLFKMIEKECAFGYSVEDGENRYTLDEFVEISNILTENKGRQETLMHLYHERMTISEDERKDLDQRAEKEMKVAVFLSNFKQDILQEAETVLYNKIKTKLIEELNL